MIAEAEAYVERLLKKAKRAKTNAEQKPNVTQAEKDAIDRKIEICEYMLSLIEKERG